MQSCQMYDVHQSREGLIEFPEDRYHKLVAEPSIPWGAGGPGSSAVYPGTGGANACGDGSTWRDPKCYKDNVPICDMSKTAGGANAQAGAVAYTINVSPARFMYFEARACRMRVVDNANTDIARETRLTAVVVNNSAREDVDDRAPTAATVTYIPTSFYEAPDTYAVAVAWGAFGRNTTPYQLGLIHFSPYAAGVVVDHSVVIFGNPLQDNSAKVAALQRGTP